MAADLDEQVEAFRTRPLGRGPVHVRRRRRVDDEGPRGRPGGQRASCWWRPASTPTGTARSSGCRSPPARPARRGTRSSPTWSPAAWPGSALVTSDAHAGLVEAIAANLPGATWQRCRTHYAANLMSALPEELVAGGQGDAAHASTTSPTPRRCTPSTTGSSTPSPSKLPEVARPPRRRPRRHPGVHRVPQGDLAPDLVQQPQRATQPRDPPPHRRRRHLPRPRRRHPPRRRRPGRAARRMGRRPPLPRPRRPRPSPPDRHPRHPSRR